MIAIRRAIFSDAMAIGAVHVAAWRSAYPGILPGAYLAELSIADQMLHYAWAIREQGGVFVATASRRRRTSHDEPRVVGFTTSAVSRSNGIAQGEIETLYVLDDWRERGVGRRLMRAAGRYLKEMGCRSVFLWVLSDNPSRWFYTRLGGRPVAESTINVGGRPVRQTAMLWEPIEKLLTVSTETR